MNGEIHTEVPLVAHEEDDTVEPPPLADEHAIDLRVRKRPKRFLEAEAQSKEHQASHFPHRPYCNICVEVHLKQKRFAKKAGTRSDDGLPAVTGTNQRLSSDTMIVARSKKLMMKRYRQGDAQ